MNTLKHLSLLTLVVYSVLCGSCDNHELPEETEGLRSATFDLEIEEGMSITRAAGDTVIMSLDDYQLKLYLFGTDTPSAENTMTLDAIYDIDKPVYTVSDLVRSRTYRFVFVAIRKSLSASLGDAQCYNEMTYAGATIKVGNAYSNCYLDCASLINATTTEGVFAKGYVLAPGTDTHTARVVLSRQFGKLEARLGAVSVAGVNFRLVMPPATTKIFFSRIMGDGYGEITVNGSNTTTPNIPVTVTNQANCVVSLILPCTTYKNPTDVLSAGESLSTVRVIIDKTYNASNIPIYKNRVTYLVLGSSGLLTYFGDESGVGLDEDKWDGIVK